MLIEFSRRWSYLWNIHNPKYNRLRGPKQQPMDQCHCPWHNTHWSSLALSTSLLKNLIRNGRQPIKVIASEVNIPYRNEYRRVCGGTLKWIMASTLRTHIYYRCSRRCYASSASQPASWQRTNERTGAAMQGSTIADPPHFNESFPWHRTSSRHAAQVPIYLQFIAN